MPLERVFIDTNVLVSAIAFSGKERQVLHLALENKITAVLSELVLGEAHRVIAAKFPGLVPRLRAELELLGYELVSDLRPALVAKAAGLVRDPGDIEILAAILQSATDVALTGDKDLLTDEVRAVAPTCRCSEYLAQRKETDD